MTTYNEHDAYAAEWLRSLIDAGELPSGGIDERSIRDLKGSDCGKTTHLFAGIGGWPLALRLAGWPDSKPVWTGSCPCQPYSSAGKQKGDADERNLWPEMFRLIRECRPQFVFGEQVASAIGHGWLDGISADLEGEGYTVGAVVLGAHSVGAPHIRQRLFWVAIARHAAQRPRYSRSPIVATVQRRESSIDVATRGVDGRLGVADGNRRQPGRNASSIERHGDTAEPASGDDGFSDAEFNRPQEHERRERPRQEPDATNTVRAWTDSLVIPCRDGKSRRISAQPGDEPLAYGVPRKLGSLVAELERMGFDPKAIKRIVRNARQRLAQAGRNRVGRLRGYGNAICVPSAVAFVQAVMAGL